MFFFSQPNSPFTFLSQLLRMVFSSFSMWAKSSEKFTITYYKAQNFCHWHKETNIGPYQLPKCCMHLMLFCTVGHFQSKRLGKNYKKNSKKKNFFFDFIDLGQRGWSFTSLMEDFRQDMNKVFFLLFNTSFKIFSTVSVGRKISRWSKL